VNDPAVIPNPAQTDIGIAIQHGIHDVTRLSLYSLIGIVLHSCSLLLYRVKGRISPAFILSFAITALQCLDLLLSFYFFSSIFTP
jgi:hypothetical protein